MKKIVSLLLVIIIACSLFIGCAVQEYLGALFTTTTTKPIPTGDPVTDDLKWEIIDDYLIWSGIQEDKKPEEIDCEFFGKYGDSVAVYFHTAGSYGEKLQRYDIAGFRFIYPDSRVIRIWNNGDFYTMSEAYELGLINDVDVEAINYPFQSMEFKEPYFIYHKKNMTIHYNILHHTDEDYIQVTIDPGICHVGKRFDINFFRGVELDRVEFATEMVNADNECRIYYNLYLKQILTYQI